MLADDAIQSISGRYYRPNNLAKRVIPDEHYLQVLGSVFVIGKKASTMVYARLYFPAKSFGDRIWLTLRKNVDLGDLTFYEEIEKSELPWNNGEPLNPRPIIPREMARRILSLTR